MQYKTVGEVLQEAAELHNRAQNAELWQSRDDRKLEYAKAERCYQWCLEQIPEDPYVLGALGSLYVEIGKWGLGVSLLLSACRVQPDQGANWNALGAGYRRMDKLPEARAALERALELTEDDKNKAFVMHNLASTYINEGEPQKAIGWCKKALALDPTNGQLRFNMGLAQLELGEFGDGFDGYELGRMATTWARNYSHPGRDVPPWDGSAGRNVVVFGEQGVGDEALFAHALPDLIRISKSVVIDCHPRLEKLFKRSFPECAVYGTRKEEVITWPQDHELDAKVPIGSLHRFFRRDRDAFPVFPEGYIIPDPAFVGEFRSSDPKQFRVGISWIGGTRDTHVALRSFPLVERDGTSRLAPILSTPGVEFVSLQYTANAGDQVKEVRDRFGWNITHDDAMNADLDKLFGCIKGLDLVITVLTSNVHFAGSMGVPAWCLTPIKAPWQFMGEDMPWYPQHKLYRQKEHGEWGEVINTIARDLRYKVEAKRAVG